MLATTVLTVFEKIKSTDPWMDAKLNSSTHFKKFYNVLTFFELVYKFAKNAYMTAKIFFSKHFLYGYQKTHLMQILNLLKKCQESFHEES
jgi:hypothetical protein